MAIGGNSYFTDLTSRLKGTAANPNPDGQEVAYQQMYKLIGDRWRDWFPESNIVWLKYFFQEILACDAFTDQAEEDHRSHLKELIARISDFKKVSDFACSLVPHSDDDHGFRVTENPVPSMSNLD